MSFFISQKMNTFERQIILRKENIIKLNILNCKFLFSDLHS